MEQHDHPIQLSLWVVKASALLAEHCTSTSRGISSIGNRVLNWQQKT